MKACQMLQKEQGLLSSREGIFVRQPSKTSSIHYGTFSDQDGLGPFFERFFILGGLGGIWCCHSDGFIHSPSFKSYSIREVVWCDII